MSTITQHYKLAAQGLIEALRPIEDLSRGYTYFLKETITDETASWLQDIIDGDTKALNHDKAKIHLEAISRLSHFLQMITQHPGEVRTREGTNTDRLSNTLVINELDRLLESGEQLVESCSKIEAALRVARQVNFFQERKEPTSFLSV